MAMSAVALLSLALPTAAQDKVFRVGLLTNGNPPRVDQRSTWRSGVLLSLDNSGYRLGRNLELVERYSEGHVDRLPSLAREIAAASVDVVVAISDPSVQAMMTAALATPIVMVVGANPVERGFVTSLARPGGRVTGLAFQTFEGDVKRLEILREAMPIARRFGRLGPPGPIPGRATELLVSAASALNIELTMQTVARLEPTEYAAALGAMRDDRVAGVLVAATQPMADDAPLFGPIAESLGLPTICEWDYMAREGCVLAYGHDLTYAHGRAGVYAARILKGASPGELPVEQSDRWKLTVNLLAAARVGLILPPALLVRADEVIE
jgi:putative ABC transport system substrate-binding protein